MNPLFDKTDNANIFIQNLNATKRDALYLHGVKRIEEGGDEAVREVV